MEFKGLKNLFRSLSNGINGIKILILKEVNAKIHLFMSLVVLVLGWYFQVKTMEWIAIFLAMGVVWSAEALNTAVEWLLDFTHPEYNKKAGRIKDVSAGGVLLAAIFATIIGLLIFAPKIFF